MQKTTHFGFKEVPLEEKEGMVRGVFTSVAARYDVMNDLMSAGLHRRWKEQLISVIRPHNNMKLLDVAGGTGDIAFRALKRAPQMQVTLCDINQAMLDEGRNRAIDNNILENIEWVCGNAEILPLPSNYYDHYNIAFGIRNVTNIPAALKEAYRVLKIGGKFTCLEFSRVNNEPLAKAYDWYSFNVIPRIGKMVAGDSESYQYLVESIRQFPPQAEFAKMITDAGFSNVRWESLQFGVVAIHSGYKV